MGLFDGIGKIFRKAAKTVTQPFRAVLPDPLADIAISATGFAIGGPPGAAIATGANEYGKSGKLIPSLAAAGGSYVGSNLGAAYGATSDIGMAGAMGPNYLGSVAGSGIGGAIGSTGGLSLANAIAPSSKVAPTSGASIPAPQTQGTRVSRLSPYGGSLGDAYEGLNPLQKRTKVATEGVYGGGTDRNMTDYLVSETNRRLLNESGGYGSYDLTPIEEQYFSGQGFGFEPGNARSLLESFARRGYA